MAVYYVQLENALMLPIVPQIAQTEVAADDSLRPTSGFALKRRAQKSAVARHYPPPQGPPLLALVRIPLGTPD
jgi:hypothetical protein